MVTLSYKSIVEHFSYTSAADVLLSIIINIKAFHPAANIAHKFYFTTILNGVVFTPNQEFKLRALNSCFCELHGAKRLV